MEGLSFNELVFIFFATFLLCLFLDILAKEGTKWIDKSFIDHFGYHFYKLSKKHRIK